MTEEREALGVGLLGLGTVGSAVADALLQRGEEFRERIGCPLVLRKAAVRDLDKPRSLAPPSNVLTANVADVLDAEDTPIVVEAIGGEYPAADFIRRALHQGKHVVTANKEVMAKHGPELLSLANANGVQLLFEASVGGGIPIIRPIRHDLAANQISSIHAIINGTTNYILTQMANNGLDFATALKQAQDMGYAEPDPTNDVDGIDASYKLAICTTLAFRTQVHASQVYCEGIRHLEARDFRYAQELGYAIKLLAIARRENGSIQARVQPCLVPEDHLLAKVDGVYNAVEVVGDLVGRVLFHGPGAGPLPTSSAVLGDVLEIARNLAEGAKPPPVPHPTDRAAVQSMDKLHTGYYLRMVLEDRSGVLYQIGAIFADLDISIASAIQKEADARTKTAEFVFTAHPAEEAAVREALERLRRLDVVKAVGNCIRVEHLPS